MAETLVLAAEKREGRGTSRARHLRDKGRVPAVVYGHKQDVVSVSVAADELSRAIRQGAHVVDLQTDGAVETAQIVDLQWDHLGKDILHVDFKRVSRDERITLDVRLELRGIAPGVTGGGILDQPLHALEVECLAIAVPDSIRVSIAELQLGQAIHVKDVKVPEGVTVLTDPEAIIVQVKAPTAEEGEAEGEEGVAEPEVIGRAKTEEGEEVE